MRSFLVLLLASSVVMCSGRRLPDAERSPDSPKPKAPPPVILDCGPAPADSIVGTHKTADVMATGDSSYTAGAIRRSATEYEASVSSGEQTSPSSAVSTSCSSPGPPSTATFDLVGIASRDAIKSNGDTLAFPGAWGPGRTATFMGRCPYRGDSASVAFHKADALVWDTSVVNSVAAIAMNDLSDSKLDVVWVDSAGVQPFENTSSGDAQVADKCLIVTGTAAQGPVIVKWDNETFPAATLWGLDGTRNENLSDAVIMGIAFYSGHHESTGNTSTVQWTGNDTRNDSLTNVIFAYLSCAYSNDTCFQLSGGESEIRNRNVTFQRILVGYTYKTSMAVAGSRSVGFYQFVITHGEHRLPEWGSVDTMGVFNGVIAFTIDKRYMSMRQSNSLGLRMDNWIVGNLFLDGQFVQADPRHIQIGNALEDTLSSVDSIYIYAGMNVIDSIGSTLGRVKPDSASSEWTGSGCTVNFVNGGACADSSLFAHEKATPERMAERLSAWQAYDTLVVAMKVGPYWYVDKDGRMQFRQDSLAVQMLQDIIDHNARGNVDMATLWYVKTADGYPDAAGLVSAQPTNSDTDPMPDDWEDACGFDKNSNDGWKVEAGKGPYMAAERYFYATDEKGVTVVINGTVEEDSAQVERFPARSGPWAHEASLIMPDTIYDRPLFSRGDSIRVIMFTGTSPDTLTAQEVPCL